MRIKNNLLVAFSVVAAIPLLSGCGGSGDGNEVVARIDGIGTITKASLTHWTRVEAVILHEFIPLHAPAKGLVPDPPDYTMCIKYLEDLTQKSGKRPMPSSDALRRECAQSERVLMKNTLAKLIGWYWEIGRGKALGMSATDGEVRQRLTEVVNEHNTYGADFSRYKRLTLETTSDMLLRSRVQLYEEKIFDQALRLVKALPSGLSEAKREQAINQIATGHLAIKNWTAKTHCSKGFVVVGCAQYHGPEQLTGAEEG